jgi:hypothetical protein
VNLDNVFLIQRAAGEREVQLKAIDFTHAFTCGREINRRLGFIEKIRDEKIYGLFPQFKSFLNREQVRQVSTRLSQFSRTVAEEVIGAIPKHWEIDTENRSVWAKMITERSHFISEHIESILWPQMEMEGGTE